MPRRPLQNRAYKKGEPHKDARLFIIVAEGDREDAYFKFFNAQNQRIRIQIIPREEGRSAPNFFLERIQNHADSGGWSPKDNDSIWFVLDVDRWSREVIETLRIQCEQNNNWYIGISNPCFEVWLLFHFLNSLPDNGESCSDLKQQLDSVSRGGFEINRLARLIRVASENASISDNNDNFYPDRMQTKLYLLAQQMLELLGNNWEN